MKSAKILALAILFAISSIGLALAAGPVKMNTVTNVSAAVKNTTDLNAYGAVKVMSFDQAGTAVGHLCKEVYLPKKATTVVNFSWQAPNYETGLYWTAKVEKGGSCGTHDTHDEESDDSDGDSLHFDSDDRH